MSNGYQKRCDLEAWSKVEIERLNKVIAAKDALLTKSRDTLRILARGLKDDGYIQLYNKTYLLYDEIRINLLQIK